MFIFLQKVFSSAEENGLETVYRLNSVRLLKGFLFFSNKRSFSPKMKNISYGDLITWFLKLKIWVVSLWKYMYVMRWFEAVVTYWKKSFFNNFS